MTVRSPIAVDFVAQYARSRPAKLACLDLDRGATFTYAQFDGRVACLASRLAGEVRPGDRVALLSRNRADALALQWACIRLGALFVPMNWRLAPAELAVLAQDCEPTVVLHEDEFSAGAAACGRQTLRLDEAVSHTADDGPRDEFAAEAVATLLYTSGTTGKPKGVIFNENNAYYSTLNFISLARIGADSVLLCDAPIFHTIGLYALARGAVQSGATLLFSSRFDPALTYERLTDPALGVTHYMGAPQMIQALRKAPGFDGTRLAHLVGLFSGGAPYPAALVRAWADEGVKLAHGYGMSECGTALCMPLDLAVIRDKADSAGLPGPMIEVGLFDAEGAPAPAGETGEIWLRGPSVSPGYWNNPEATATARHGDWLKTGDVAWRDDEGFIHVCDRLKDMYISGGENVYPAEVEAVLASHPDVSEVAVVGMADPKWGEVGWAVIVGPAAEDELVDLCRAQLAGYKLPKRFVRMDSLPRTVSGKIQKHLLRERLKDIP